MAVRSVEAIDRDLHEQVERRDAGTAEVLHGLFLIHRSTLVIDRLIEERLAVAANPGEREKVRSR